MNRATIHYPDGLHTWGVHLESDDPFRIEKFKQFCWGHFPKNKFCPFLQSDSPGYVYFEFWGNISEDNSQEIQNILNIFNE